MSNDKLNLGSRLLIGAIAGFVGTLAMTAAMSRLHRRLPPKENYPLTPREIIDSMGAKAGAKPTGELAKDLTTAAHFGYGAAAGSLIAAANPRIGPATGAAAGVAIWTASYMGWIPAAGILKPATEHPPRRNLLMIGVHLVWGASTALALRELRVARETILRDGPDKDAPPA
ncbi:MAG TPA: hypothetical protein VNT77_08905 [Allosphingosinicella sp.]|nr:hypothetical protein [Allosphingosinicella sp.]